MRLGGLAAAIAVAAARAFPGWHAGPNGHAIPARFWFESRPS